MRSPAAAGSSGAGKPPTSSAASAAAAAARSARLAPLATPPQSAPSPRASGSSAAEGSA